VLHVNIIDFINKAVISFDELSFRLDGILTFRQITDELESKKLPSKLTLRMRYDLPTFAKQVLILLELVIDSARLIEINGFDIILNLDHPLFSLRLRELEPDESMTERCVSIINL